MKYSVLSHWGMFGHNKYSDPSDLVGSKSSVHLWQLSEVSPESQQYKSRGLLKSGWQTILGLFR